LHEGSEGPIYNENYKSLNKEIECCEYGYITKSNLRVQCNSHQNANEVHHSDRKANPQVHMEAQRPRIAKAIPSKKSNAGGITIPDFKLHYSAIAGKPVWDWHRNRHEDSGSEDPDTNPQVQSLDFC
jgi:hypothetical protein